MTPPPGTRLIVKTFTFCMSFQRNTRGNTLSDKTKNLSEMCQKYRGIQDGQKLNHISYFKNGGKFSYHCSVQSHSVGHFRKFLPKPILFITICCKGVKQTSCISLTNLKHMQNIIKPSLHFPVST